MARKFLTMDGNEAAAHAAYAYTEVATIYPITPSSVMPEHIDEWATAGRKNIFGQKVRVTELQSEAGAAASVHGSIAAGAMTSTFTASQGLLLMIPNLYKIAGEGLPAVCNVSARCVCSHALNIFGDHSDVYAARQTGCAMLCESSVQEVMDLTPVAYCAAVKGKLPFINFFDGFRTSHEIQKIQIWDYEDLDELIDHDAIAAFRANCLNPTHPREMGSAQNPDIFFQAREASNTYYDKIPEIVTEYMDKVNAEIGTDYKLFNYYGAPDAEQVIVAMGSVNDTIEETIDYLLKQGKKVGLVKVRLYRPFVSSAFAAAIPSTVKKITVLDRTKEPGSIGEPLYLDVVAALKQEGKFQDVPVYTGRYGLGSKDCTPAQIISVYNNDSKPRFTIGITDDVTNLSLPITENPNTTPEGTTCCKFWGLGSDGTVGANKNSIKIIGDHTDMYAQAYFEYDAKKSFGVTRSHLKFSDKPIRGSYLVQSANFVACHNQQFILDYDIVEDVKEEGDFLLNTSWDLKELSVNLPARVRRMLHDKKVNFYTIDASGIARELGLGSHINMILQAAFFAIARVIPMDEAVDYMKDAVRKTYFAKGDKIVNLNISAVERGISGFRKIDIPAEWADAEDEVIRGADDRPDVVRNILEPLNRQKGDELPVSSFTDRQNGAIEMGLTAYEKRNIATSVPVWDPAKCVQCNRCAMVCSHAVLRPYLLTKEEAIGAPDGTVMTDAKGKGAENMKYTLQCSSADCTSCMSCVNNCPAKALTMGPVPEVDLRSWNYCLSLDDKEDLFDPYTVKGSQFRRPLLEFSAACAGCGETVYAKLMTQLFGDRCYWANGTGCSQAWGAPMPGVS